ncbi:MAG: hypothetical protein NWF07_05120 [Candidatus Bathyarchaeota archaeon]|nr:hypothetical protein [Candidatus Bathyarchaeota archaeon]
MNRRPMARAQDIYKLLFQGVFGVAHIVSDKAWNILIEEAGRINLKEHSEDPLIEPVSPDASMVRVNLRQYINGGGDLESLYQVMRKSAEHKGDDEVFLDYWGQYKRMVTEGLVSGAQNEIDELDNLISTEGVKPRHHTEPYRQAYYPAYRVVVMKIYNEYTVSSG